MKIRKIRKITAVCILAAMLAGLSACGSKEPAATDTPGTSTETDNKETAATETEEKDKQGQGLNAASGQQENTAEGQESGPVTIKVFCMNDDATQLIEESVQIDALSPENVLKALTEKGIVPEDVGILSLEESEKDGDKVLDVDFSQAFGDYMGNVGSTEEYMVMGSICNTFLNAYGCEKIHIMVEGEVLTTGHKEYTGYQKFYE